MSSFHVVKLINHDGTAKLGCHNHIYEFNLPEWSGWLSRDGAQKTIADLRKFCDEAEAALTFDQPEEAVSP